MPLLTSRVQANALIAEVQASLASAIDASRTALIATLNSEVTRLGQLRDLMFPAEDTSDGLFFINAGGSVFDVWESSNGFAGGVAGQVSTGLIVRGDANSAPIEVLGTYLEGWSSWSRTLAAGTYRFRLSFLDSVKALAGQRVFDLLINGSTYLHNFDVIALSGGPDQALSEDIVVAHPGGLLTISAQASVGSTLINGIKIMDATGDPVSTPVAVALTVPSDAYLAEYFPNSLLTAPATVAQIEAAPISHNWGTGAPVAGFVTDHWTARWRGNFTFGAHDYVFSIVVDDGYALYIDGVLVGTSWIVQPATAYSHTVSMSAGVHEVRIDYLEVTGSASLTMSFAQAASDPTNPPATMVTNVANSWPSTVPEKDFTFDGAVDYWARPSDSVAAGWGSGYVSAFESSAAFRGPAPLTNLVAGTEDMLLVLPKGAPATSLVLKEPFTAADGTALSAPYTPSTLAAGSSLTVQSNALRMRTTAGGYTAQARFLSGLSAFADGADGGTFVLPTLVERYFYGYVRAPGNWTGASVSMGLEIAPDLTAGIFIFDADGTQVATASITPVAGHRYGYERTYVGAGVTFKMWDITAGQTRDTGASCAGTVAYLTAGTLQFANIGGSAAVTNDVNLEYVWAVSGSGWFTYYFIPTADPGGGGGGGGGGGLSWFTVTADGHIHDSNGANFISKGVSLGGPGFHQDWFANGFPTTLGLSAGMAKWGFNTIRLQWAPDAGGSYNSDLVAIVKEFTDAGHVVALDYHSGISGSYPSYVAGLSNVIAHWQYAANLFKDNPLVWFELWNEPGSGGHPIEQIYYDDHAAIINAIRAIAPNNVIVLDDSSWGQGVSTWDGSYVTDANSGLIHFGPALKALHAGPLVGSWHVYNQWQAGGHVAIKAQMLDYLGKCRALGIPMIMGEGGADGYDNGAIQGYHEGWQGCMDACTTGGYGVWAWHGQSDARSDFALTNAASFADTSNGVGFEGSLMKAYSGGTF